MSTAAQVDIELDQGSDFAIQIYWTTTENIPYSIQSPMRMEIRNSVGGVVQVLQIGTTDEDEVLDPDDATILYNPESGLVQLQLTSAQTDAIGPGLYDYDLFLSYLDSGITGRVRTKRLIAGRVKVNGRITQNVSGG